MRADITVLAGVLDPSPQPVCPFSDAAVDFLDALSGRILASGQQLDPEITAFGFWCRRAHIRRLRERCGREAVRLGRGLVFHIAPANVPAMFAYSYAVGLLAGNANIVRISRRSGPITLSLCALIRDTLEMEAFRSVRERSSIVAYEQNDRITGDYLARSDARVIWGGNRTISRLRSFPVSPYSVEAVFPDRWSAALFSQRALTEADDDALAAYVHRFFNDTYVMDQQGCSSPQMVLWLCDGGSASVRNRFWERLAAEAERTYPMDAYKAARKLEQLCLAAMGSEHVRRFQSYGGNLLYVLGLDGIPDTPGRWRGSFGLFYETELRTPEELLSRLDPTVQTLSCIGVDRKALARRLAESGARGVDRIVACGQALEMDTVWDGKDLIALLSREISCE